MSSVDLKQRFGSNINRQNTRGVLDMFKQACIPFIMLAAHLACFTSYLAAQKVSSEPTDIFSGAESSTTFPFEWREGLVFLLVSVDGSRPLNFVLDSGSTRILIDRSLAASLGIKASEAGSLQGAGAGRIQIEALHNIDLKLPRLDSKSYDCFTADLAPLEQTLKTRVDGILGYDFFRRFVITIDFVNKQITIALPVAFHPSNKAEEIPLDIRGKWPFVKGKLLLPGPVNVEDSFYIDSGSSDAVDHPIAKAMQSRVASKSGIGLGAPVEGAVAKADSFQIGTFTIKDPIVSCCGATDATSRIIGTEILRRFTVTFDYPSSRIFLSPNASLREEFPAIPSASK